MLLVFNQKFEKYKKQNRIRIQRHILNKNLLELKLSKNENKDFIFFNGWF